MGLLTLATRRFNGVTDVFLSPMKPRDKVVTAEDIQSSLYYVHVDQPEDARLVTPPPAPVPTDPVPRKAVPGTLPPSLVPGAQPPKRKPVPGTLAPVTDFESRQNINAANYHGGTQHGQQPFFSSTQHVAETNKLPPPLKRPTEPPSSLGTSLTLIRRDPGSNAQWNVALIDDSPVLDVSSFALNNPTAGKKGGTPVWIEVTNPGYSKFLHIPDRPDLVTRSSDFSTRSQMTAYSTAPAHVPLISDPASIPTGESDIGETVFRRRLWMEASKSANPVVGHRKNNSYDSSLGRRSPRSSLDVYDRDNPSMTLRPPGTPPGLTREDQNNIRVQPSDRQSTFRGYVFMSPWNGRCEFITGAGGGSLKVCFVVSVTPAAKLTYPQCRHVIHGLQGATPLAMPVSELRFNLPSSLKGTAPVGEESSKRSSLFHRPRHARHHSAASEMDLSLGQEFAGGGFGGKQAKLGKLIIEDEGLKMMDLLVAANMALWWRAYEKADGRSRGERGS